MVTEIWLIHHSHTDIGFTHPQPTVFELHRRYIDEVLDLIEQHAGRPDAERFRWTCESAGIAWDWWQQAAPAQRARFLAAAQAGLMDVAALRWNMTPLADHASFAEQLRECEQLRAEGLTIRSAMQSDVDGLPWGAVRLLLDHGIDGFSMAINEHFGRAVSPRPGAFWWEAPDGGRILTWNGPHYHSTPNRAMRIGGPIEEARPATEWYLSQLADHHYPLSVLGVQPTHIYFSDNDAPDAGLPDFVQRWNAQGHPVSMRLATLTQFLDRLRQEPGERLITQRGDWTDWWNFGSGSTARETRLHLQGQRDLQTARQVQAWTGTTGRFETVATQAEAALTLYAEHTWGADWGAATAESDETAIQLSHKLEYAYRGVTLARQLKRDALLQLARQLPGDGPGLLVYNPHPSELQTMLQVPTNTLRYAPNMAHLAQRFDVEFGGRKGTARWVGPVRVPALGWTVLPLNARAGESGLPSTPTGLGAALPDDQLGASSDGLMHETWRIGNGLTELTFDPAGGVQSLKIEGREFARPGQPLARLVLEQPEPARRNAIFGPPQWDAFDMHAAWHHDWQARREEAELRSSESRTLPGAVEHIEQLTLFSGERAEVVYRLHPADPALHLQVTLWLQQDATPRATYLHLPFALTDDARTHFETAGAVVEFDREQLPGSSRHYLTTLDWLRMQDAQSGVTVATPDAPLWQVGGFTFGRFQSEGRAPGDATLNAWLTNNYWDTNFKADQAGELRFSFVLMGHPSEPVAESSARAAARVRLPDIQVFTAQGGPVRDAHLLDLDLGGLRLTGLTQDPASGTLALQILNPDGEARQAQVGAGRLRPLRVSRQTLAGQTEAEASAVDGRFAVEVPGRAWCTLAVEVDAGASRA